VQFPNPGIERPTTADARRFKPRSPRLRGRVQILRGGDASGGDDVLYEKAEGHEQLSSALMSDKTFAFRRRAGGNRAR